MRWIVFADMRTKLIHDPADVFLLSIGLGLRIDGDDLLEVGGRQPDAPAGFQRAEAFAEHERRLVKLQVFNDVFAEDIVEGCGGNRKGTAGVEIYRPGLKWIERGV